MWAVCSVGMKVPDLAVQKAAYSAAPSDLHWVVQKAALSVGQKVRKRAVSWVALMDALLVV